MAEAGGHRIDSFLELVVRQGGSDLHLVAGNPPRIRLYGELIEVKYRTLGADETEELIGEILPPIARRTLAERLSVDFAYEVPGLARFRVNVFRHLDGVGAVLRVIPNEVPSLAELGLPPVVRQLCQQRRGLILVTGPTGSGKSTTLAAMVDAINRSRRGHIITIEDPVEYLHTRRRCLVSQREVGVHTRDFAAALRSALREDPDVLLVGEMRDLETIHLAATAAETGILVLGTLHTNGAAAAVDRMINVFPATQQPLIRTILSTSLVAVLSQQLLRRADGRGRVAAVEVLLNTPAAANLIREGKSEQLVNVIQSGALVGMQSLDAALRRLVDAGLVRGQEAYLKAVSKAEFEHLREPDLE
ncbi:type IV pilus twitching motility protein PilT [Inmirania thermothiophila]|uniref:Twitching motility protein PilT n=1 Tax=Inmirania thermothiophila TaxID=1750597 RepID=A0A3N1XZZ5_9GAMM|nr:type IV pilus twitching motility protein PilT [Inmirania thermothiophila]ROR32156.1 twitching motility protein PilT [Inmirania thermothiophila]